MGGSRPIVFADISNMLLRFNANLQWKAAFKKLLMRIISVDYVLQGVFVAKRRGKTRPNSCVGCFCLSDVGSCVEPGAFSIQFRQKSNANFKVLEITASAPSSKCHFKLGELLLASSSATRHSLLAR